MSNRFIISKYSGTKNSFFIFDSRATEIKNKFYNKFNLKRNEFVKYFFDRNGLGQNADGFIFIENPINNKNDFRWDFYNKDGSSAEMCGNASRCVSIFAKERMKIEKKIVHFETLSGDIEATIESSDLVKVKMTKYEIKSKNIIDFDGIFVNSGVPHAVIEYGEFNFEEMKKIAKKIRNDKNFGLQGTNVTFLNSTLNKVITFERGVEDFTESCGTGAVAAAVYLGYKSSQLTEKILMYDLNVPGGNLLIQLMPDTDKYSGDAFLTGEVSFHFNMEI